MIKKQNLNLPPLVTASTRGTEAEKRFLVRSSSRLVEHFDFSNLELLVLHKQTDDIHRLTASAHTVQYDYYFFLKLLHSGRRSDANFVSQTS